MKIVIFFVAIILLWILSPIFILYAIFRSPKNIGNYLFDIAFSIDQLGNVMGAPIMNDVLIKKDAIHKYGNPDETISHVTGVNYLWNSLTIFGTALKNVLNFLDKNHVEKAAKNNQ